MTIKKRKPTNLKITSKNSIATTDRPESFDIDEISQLIELGRLYRLESLEFRDLKIKYRDIQEPKNTPSNEVIKTELTSEDDKPSVKYPSASSEIAEQFEDFQKLIDDPLAFEESQVNEAE